MNEKFSWALSNHIDSCYEYIPSVSNSGDAESAHNLMESIYKEYEEKAIKANLDILARENFLIIDMVVNDNDLANIYKNIKNANCDKIVIIPFVISYQGALNDILNAPIFFLKSVFIDNANLINSINIQESIFFEDIYFGGCTFEKEANFSENIFCGQVDFNRSNFKEKASFFGSTFIDDVDLSFTSFKDKAYFTNATFYGKLDLEKSNTTGGLWLQDIYLKSFIYTNGSSFDKLILEKITFFDQDPSQPIRFDDYFKNLKATDRFSDRLESLRFTFNLLKSTYTQNYNHIEANNFYALEMKVFNKELKWGKHFWQKLVFFISWATSNFGQSIFIPLFWLTILFSLWLFVAYCSPDITKKIALDVLFSISFSFSDFKFKNINTWHEFSILFLFGLSKAFSLVLYWNLGKAIKKNIRWG